MGARAEQECEAAGRATRSGTQPSRHGFNGERCPQDYVQAHKWAGGGRGVAERASTNTAAKLRESVAGEKATEQIAEAPRLPRMKPRPSKMIRVRRPSHTGYFKSEEPSHMSLPGAELLPALVIVWPLACQCWADKARIWSARISTLRGPKLPVVVVAGGLDDDRQPRVERRNLGDQISGGSWRADRLGAQWDEPDRGSALRPPRGIPRRRS